MSTRIYTLFVRFLRHTHTIGAHREESSDGPSTTDSTVFRLSSPAPIIRLLSLALGRPHRPGIDQIPGKVQREAVNLQTDHDERVPQQTVRQTLRTENRTPVASMRHSIVSTPSKCLQRITCTRTCHIWMPISSTLSSSSIHR